MNNLPITISTTKENQNMKKSKVFVSFFNSSQGGIYNCFQLILNPVAAKKKWF